MESIKISTENALKGACPAKLDALRAASADALKKLYDGTGKGNDFLGWVNLPSATPESELDDIIASAQKLRSKCEYVVAIGIGGSYLGSKAVIDALNDSFAAYKGKGENPHILFAGQNIGEDYTYELQSLLAGKEFGIVVISKSGTTTEPAITFRILKEMLEAQVGEAEAAERIIAITDAKRGALRKLATEKGYKTFVIDDNVGGRFSVLSPVGLLPIAVAGYDIKALMNGAKMMQAETAKSGNDNVAETYAITRNALYNEGKKIEILVNYNPKLHYFGEWWKQLYGESEGKDGKGIFPAAVDNSTDLHSMGQMIQDGERTIYETVISVMEQKYEMCIPSDEADLDGLNYIAGKRIDEVNKMAELGTRIAHMDGGVPNLEIQLASLNEYNLGAMIYFFEIACGISGYILGVNPFDQPGVEDYKRNMFALLNKPGYEEASKAIAAKL
ncbi:MAG: glucose-6-phosphate isomerase [Bacteroidales bacterium]